MKHFISVKDVEDVHQLVDIGLRYKSYPLSDENLGYGKTLGVIFFNSSLRTRLSTQKAAQNLGLNSMLMNVNQDSWGLEFNDGVVMNGNTAEHIKEAAAVMGEYCDILAIRSFPGLEDREADYSDLVIRAFQEYSGVPIISLESATRHPLQSLADLITMKEFKPLEEKTKVVLTWAPHPRALPQSVANSFAEWVTRTDVEFVIANPEGYDLHPEFTFGAKVMHNQDEALKGADFVYAKNWSSFEDYGKILSQDESWMISKAKMDLTNNAKFMHCLPVRRNVIVGDEVLDSDSSVVIQEAGNRVYSCQAVLASLLKSM